MVLNFGLGTPCNPTESLHGPLLEGGRRHSPGGAQDLSHSASAITDSFTLTVFVCTIM